MGYAQGRPLRGLRNARQVSQQVPPAGLFSQSACLPGACCPAPNAARMRLGPQNSACQYCPKDWAAGSETPSQRPCTRIETPTTPPSSRLGSASTPRAVAAALLPPASPPLWCSNTYRRRAHGGVVVMQVRGVQHNRCTPPDQTP